MNPRCFPWATRFTRAMAWSRLCSFSLLSTYITCSIGASKPVSSMSHTTRNAIPVFALSGSSKSKGLQKFSTALHAFASLRAAVISADSFVGCGDDHRHLKEGNAPDEFLIRLVLGPLDREPLVQSRPQRSLISHCRQLGMADDLSLEAVGQDILDVVP